MRLNSQLQLSGPVSSSGYVPKVPPPQANAPAPTNAPAPQTQMPGPPRVAPQSLTYPSSAPQQSTSSTLANPYGQPAYPTQVPTSSSPTATAPLTTGNWRQDEMHRLQELAEQSKAQSPIQAIDWDWVISTFGPTRTRPVILYFCEIG